MAGNFYNATPNTNPPIYTQDRTRQATYPLTLGAYSGRMTWQPTPRNKVTTYYTLERAIYEHYINQTLNDPDVTLTSNWRPDYVGQARWTSPVTNRLLLEAGWTYVNFNYSTALQPGLSLSTPYSYRELNTGYVWGNYQQDPAGNPPGSQAEFMGPGANSTHQMNVNVSASYVTGSHAAKVGFRLMQSEAYADRLVTGNGVTLQLRNGAASQVTQYATPIQFNEKLKANIGIFGQDQWTMKRLTVNAGVRFDYLNAYIPAQTLPAGPLVPERSFPQTDNVPNWKDVSPRLGASLRSVRQRQDGGQGEHRPVSGRRRTVALHACRRSGDERRGHGDPSLERRQWRSGPTVHVHQFRGQRRMPSVVGPRIRRQPHPDAL